MNNFEMLYFFSAILFSTSIRKVLVCLFLFVCLFFCSSECASKKKQEKLLRSVVQWQSVSGLKSGGGREFDSCP